MSTSWRTVVRGHGRIRANWNAPGIHPTSVVHISAAEISSEQNHIFATDRTAQRFAYHLGDADIWVSNISPHVGGVEYILHINWHEPLPVAVTFTVEGEPPIEIQNP